MKVVKSSLKDWAWLSWEGLVVIVRTNETMLFSYLLTIPATVDVDTE